MGADPDTLPRRSKKDYLIDRFLRCVHGARQEVDRARLARLTCRAFSPWQQAARVLIVWPIAPKSSCVEVHSQRPERVPSKVRGGKADAKMRSMKNAAKMLEHFLRIKLCIGPVKEAAQRPQELALEVL
ncbi:hypothetical protein AK812_SmicGene31586 [Symbiodinium microadriaticum]|uniref:Uncharacterized protein n=1 Tax=Symbiodinium microadriaticum TaxID=2951 RepID=A0A1Q9CWD2_SYMMI|nr:hypothetical protein AK812_SmicGene31586 [Symbiodinium microadriaticum]